MHTLKTIIYGKRCVFEFSYDKKANEHTVFCTVEGEKPVITFAPDVCEALYLCTCTVASRQKH